MARKKAKSISLKELTKHYRTFSQVVSMASSEVPFKKIRHYVYDRTNKRLYNSSIQLLRQKIIIAEKLRLNLVSLIKGNYQHIPMKMRYCSAYHLCLDSISYEDRRIKAGVASNSDLRFIIQLLNIYRHNGKMLLS